MELIYKVKKPETIKRFMTENNIPTSILDRSEKNYKIFVNNEIKMRKDTVRKNDKIHFVLADEGLNKNVKPEEFKLDIVYEDDYLLIVNKPANMLLNASKVHPHHTLANYLVDYYMKNNINNSIHYVNKLDREASGLMVVAKHRFIKFLLSEKLNNQLSFDYKAIVEGKMPVMNFDICLPIKKQDESFKREVAESGGEDCSTKYTVEKEFKNYSLLKLEVTGKLPHQIRVHLAYFDRPVVGDKVYDSSIQDRDLMLFCYKTSFVHPITELEVKVELDLPDSFKDFIKTI